MNTKVSFVLCYLFFINTFKNVAMQQELPGDYAELVEQCTPVFQENIVSAFNNEMARNHRRKDFIKTTHNLDTILLSLDNTKMMSIESFQELHNILQSKLCKNDTAMRKSITPKERLALTLRELSDLKLPWLPDFKVVNLAVNLCKLCLDIHFKLGDLKVNGNYEVNNVALQKVLPVSSNGTISVNFSDVSVQGRVGLLIQGDSFMPQNYDVEYTWGEAEVTVNYFVNKETQVENKITSPSGEQVLAEKIWLQLKEILTTILRDQLKSVVVEYSVTESLADEDEKLRQLSAYQSTKANGLFDTILCAAKDYLVAKNYRTIETPPFDVIYRGKLSSTEQGIFQSGVGFVKDLSTLSRLTDLSLFEDERQLLVYGTLGMRDFKHGYEKFTTKYEDNELTGSIKAQIYATEIFVKLSFEKNLNNPQKTKVEKIETRLLSDIEADTSGLGSLSWLIPKTQSWVMGHLRSNSMEVLLKHIEEAFNFAIDDELRKTQVNDLEGEKSRLFWSSMFVRHY